MPTSSSTPRIELMKMTESPTTLSTTSISPSSTHRPAIVPETTRFPTRKPQVTSSTKTTTITIPISTYDDLSIISEGTTMFDRFDETTIATEFNDSDHMTTQPIFTSTTSKVTYILVTHSYENSVILLKNSNHYEYLKKNIFYDRLKQQRKVL